MGQSLALLGQVGLSAPPLGAAGRRRHTPGGAPEHPCSATSPFGSPPLSGWCQGGERRSTNCFPFFQGNHSKVTHRMLFEITVMGLLRRIPVCPPCTAVCPFSEHITRRGLPSSRVWDAWLPLGRHVLGGRKSQNFCCEHRHLSTFNPVFAPNCLTLEPTLFLF